MIVGITCPVTQVLHQLGRRIKNMGRRHQGSCVFGGFHGFTEGFIDCIRLWSAGEVDCELGKYQLTLR